MKKPTKNQILMIVLMITFLVLIALYAIINKKAKNISQNQTPQATQTQLNIEQKNEVEQYLNPTQSMQSNRISGVVYSGESPALPEMLSLYQNISVRPLENQVAEDIANVLGMKKNVVYGLDLWSSDNYSMDYSLTTKTFSIYRDSEKENGGELEPIQDLNELETIARNFVNSMSPEADIVQLIPNKTQFMTEEDPGEHSEDKATIAGFSFMPLLEGIPLYPEKDLDAPYTVLVNSKGEIVKAIINPQFLKPTKTGIEKPIGLEQALNNINDGQALLLRSGSENYPNYDPQSIQSGLLSNAELQYRQMDDGKTIIPFYKFDGTFHDRYGTPFEGIVITPAIVVQ